MTDEYDKEIATYDRIADSAPKMLEALKRVKQDLIYQYSPYVFDVNFRYIDEAIKEAEGHGT